MSRRRRHFTEEELRNLPDASREARRRALQSLGLMREKGLSLTEATDRADTSRRTMLKYAHWALEKDEAGQWEPTSWDRIPRMMLFPTPTGTKELYVRDSRSASKIADYWNAFDHYQTTGDPGPVSAFRNEVVQVRGEEHEFPTEPRLLDRLAFAGEASFLDLYASNR